MISSKRNGAATSELLSSVGSIFSTYRSILKISNVSGTLTQTTGHVLKAYDRKGEFAIGITQALIALFVLAFHIVSSAKSGIAMANGYVVLTLLVLIASSSLRIFFSLSEKLPERTLCLMNLFDISLFVLLIWSYQFAYSLPAGSVLKSPSQFLILALVATRALRFHPLPILSAGLAALFGQLLLIVGALYRDGKGSISGSYANYLSSNEILIGAEIEKLTAMFAMVFCLTVGTIVARNLLHQIDHVIENLPQGIALVDSENRLTVFNNMFRKLYRYRNNQLSIGARLDELSSDLELTHKIDVSGHGVERRSNGEGHNPSIATIHETKDGQLLSVKRKSMPNGSMISTTEDVTQIQKMEYLAFHDPLTGLANRTKLDARLSELQAADHVSGALLCLDLDNFKPVNDVHGHQCGDELLIAVANRMRDCVRAEDLIVRMGGDEFTIVVEADEPEAAAERLCECLLSMISKPFELSNAEVSIGTSIGVRVFHGKIGSASGLIQEADAALYQAKAHGRNQSRFFNSET